MPGCLAAGGQDLGICCSGNGGGGVGPLQARGKGPGVNVTRAGDGQPLLCYDSGNRARPLGGGGPTSTRTQGVETGTRLTDVEEYTRAGIR